MSSKDSRKLSPLTTSWHNRSRSSINSDAAVYYSAQAHQQPTPIELQHQSPRISSPDSFSSHEPRSFKMDRQDSGYAENITPIPSHVRSSSRPPSTSSSRPRPSLSATRRSSTHSKRSSTASSSTPRSTPKRPSKSRTSTSTSRSHLSSRQPPQQQQYQYFQFPSLADDLSSDPSPPPPPPATIHYWTSDQTRRLEYAAIDAASKGIRGLITRCIPDCFLPVESRRRRFCKGEDVDDDAGSVRRYRLVMAEEGADEKKGKGHRRRWSAPWKW
ncbi:hypothetical protein CJF31_00008250 [Rutstroemia sp. NJR-2017a BVV2]|nr:hypothetical protein CJF31_00008250 [Rutstroemia sp. NJR-2017a BVV2]